MPFVKTNTQKTKKLICARCASAFRRRIKDINRSKRQGYVAFYCSRSCAGKTVHKNYIATKVS